MKERKSVFKQTVLPVSLKPEYVDRHVLHVKDPTPSTQSAHMMAVKLSASRTDSALLPRNILISVSDTNFCLRLSKPQGPVRPEGLCNLMKIIHLNGSQTRDFPALKKSVHRFSSYACGQKNKRRVKAKLLIILLADEPK
jgi:hypothetical protein